MEKIKETLPSIIFNILETILVILVGLACKINIMPILIVLMTFTIVRLLCKESLHYKDPKECLIWTAITLVTILLLTKVRLIIAVLMAIIAALLLSKKGNINEVYMWKGKRSNFQDIDDYLKEHKNDEKIATFEELMKKRGDLVYQLYILRFYQHYSFAKIQEELDLDGRRITDKLEAIAMSFRVFFDI